MGLVNAPTLPRGALQLPLALLAAQGVTMALAWTLGRVGRFPPPVRGALMVVGAFGNSGFLGYPMTLALHRNEFPAAILMDQFGMTIAMYLSVPLIWARLGTAGGAGTRRRGRVPALPALAAVPGADGRDGGRHSLPGRRGLLHAPDVAAIGQVVGQCLTYLGQGSDAPGAAGTRHGPRPSAGRAYVGPLLLASALKLLVSPLAMCLPAGPWDCGVICSPSFSHCCMPTSVTASVLCAEHDLEGDFAVSVAFGTTILSAFTLPLVLSLLR